MSCAFQHGQFRGEWDVESHVTVQPDGSFYQNARVKTVGDVQPVWVQIKGRISSNKLQADIGNPYCAGHLSLTK
jgi:hypothetical protein